MRGKTKLGHGARPSAIDARLLRRWPLPRPDTAQGKDGRGSLLVVGGCEQVPGAVVLAGLAALRVGLGRLQIATAAAVAPAMGVALPEARVSGLRQHPNGEIHATACRVLRSDLQGKDAVLIGPGMGPEGRGAARSLLRQWVSGGMACPAVLDAGGLAALRGGPPRPRAASPCLVVTPHAGEMAQLWDTDPAEIRRRPLEIARAAAAELGAVVILKGETTFVATPDGTAFVNEAGTGGLGTSGSGDVLSGIVAGLCARGASPAQAAVWAVFIHAKAGERLARRIAPLGFLARELLDELPGLVQRLAPFAE
jgi:ADP-dependent NAD(P)H-hydrate dehydratase